MAEDRFELSPTESLYPKGLLDLVDRAPKVYGVGDPTVLASNLLAVCGSRKATPYGIAVAGQAARTAAEEGYTVINGGARGCEEAACREALAAGGRIVVCCYSGADVKPPSMPEDVYDSARKYGAIVSFEPFGTEPLAHGVRKKNEFMARLAGSLLIAEAAIPSGIMHTAEVAYHAGKSVYAVPGTIFSQNSTGTNMLIAQGHATVIESMSSLASHLSQKDHQTVNRNALPISGNPERDAVIAALAGTSVTPQSIADMLDMERVDVLYNLAVLERDGVATRLPNGRYALRHQVRSMLAEAKAAQSTRTRSDLLDSGIKR